MTFFIAIENECFLYKNPVSNKTILLSTPFQTNSFGNLVQFISDKCFT